jgi:hypothetical protein
MHRNVFLKNVVLQILLSNLYNHLFFKFKKKTLFLIKLEIKLCSSVYITVHLLPNFFFLKIQNGQKIQYGRFFGSQTADFLFLDML